MSFVKNLLSGALLLLSAGVNAQIKNLYNYQDLSHLYYEKQKDSLKKAWACPDAFKEKAAQKKYKEIWDQRTEEVTGAIAHDDYVHDKEVYGYIEDILRQLTDANKQLVPVQPFLLIDRSPAVNAYASGSNVLSVNLGLIAYAT